MILPTCRSTLAALAAATTCLGLLGTAPGAAGQTRAASTQASTPVSTQAAPPSSRAASGPAEGIIRDEVRELPARLRTLRRKGVKVSAPRKVRTGKRIVVRGRLLSGPGRRQLRLAERRGGRWQVRDRDRARRGEFRLRTGAGRRARTRTLRLEVVGRAGRVKPVSRLRVKVVPGGSSTPSAPPVKNPPTPAPQAPQGPAAPLAVPAGSGDDWSWLFSKGGGRWDPCTPIGWGYDASGGYRGSLEDLRTAVAVVAERTGLELVYQGARGSDLQVRWSTAAQDPQLAGSVVGYAGASGWKVPSRADVAFSLGNGRVVLDREGQLRPGFATSGRATWGQVMIHELLHALGLGHANGREQIMHGSASSWNHRLGAGDLTGIRKIGSSRGCLPSWGSFRRSAHSVQRRMSPVSRSWSS